MPAALPPPMPERIVCSIEAAVKYRVPANIVLAVAEKEGGKPGQWVKNTNDTYDVGPMQFNTRYLADLRKYGITAADVARAGCYSYELAAWRLRGHLLHDSGDIWTRAANYHSRTPEYNAPYRADLIRKAAKWGQWIKARFDTYDPTAATASVTPATGAATPALAVAKPKAANPAKPQPARYTPRHYNRAAAAALAAVYAPGSLK